MGTLEEETSRLRALAEVVSGSGSGSEPDNTGFHTDKIVEGNSEGKTVSGNGLSSGRDKKVEESSIVGLSNGISGVSNCVKGKEKPAEFGGENGFSVGDLVWGKISSRSWWPGQIYDPKNATDYAMRFNHEGRFLVAYFGDGSYSWCKPSQMMPFAEHFEEMSNQTSPKSFVNGVRDAVNEIGMLVEKDMTCKCVPEENMKGLQTPVSGNCGIRGGVLVPEGGIGKLLSFRYYASELLATVQNIAEAASFPHVLDLEILMVWLSAFSRYRYRGYSLPVFHEGMRIEGLEDKYRDWVTGSDFSVPVGVPLQRPCEVGWTTGEPNGDKVCHKRKEKSVAELLGEGLVVNSENRTGKREVNGDIGDRSDIVGALATGRKRGRKKIDDMTKGENVHIQFEDENEKSSEWKEGGNVVADDTDNGGTKGTEDMSSPRERKKSKYLSAPYTDAQFRAGKLSSKKQLENETVKISNAAMTGETMVKANSFRGQKSSPKKEVEEESVRISKITRIGERMTKTAGILLDSPPLVKCNGETVYKKRAYKGNEIRQLDSTVDPNSPRSKQDEKKLTDTEDVSVSLKKVLDVAVNPMHVEDENLLDMVRGFISRFRSSVYLHGANYRSYHKRQPGRQRKSSSSGEGSVENGFSKSPESKDSQPVGQKIDLLGDLDTPRLKKARVSVVKSNDKNVQGKASPASLVLTFPAGFPLPSKNVVVRKFSKFGVLNEKETVVLGESGTVQIVYGSRSGAEEALRAALMQSPFSSIVNYKLFYAAPPAAVDFNHDAVGPFVEVVDEEVASRAAVDVQLPLGSARQNLMIMTSMLEKCDGRISQEAASNLDGEIKHLVEKVRKMTEAAALG